MATTTDTYKLIVETDEALSRIANLGKAVSAAFVGMIGVVASFADEITDTADAFNATTAEVIALSSALAAVGGKGDNAVKIFKGINDAISELNDGNLKTLKNFEDLGISLGQLGTMSESAIRNQVINNLAAMENATERNALAFKMFGKAAIGVDFSKLAKEIQDNAAEAEKYAQAIEDAGAAYDSMAKMLKQVKMAFAEAFNPVFKILAETKISTDSITTAFKVLATVLVGVVAPIMAIRTAITLATAAQVAFNTVANMNPWVRAGTLILTGITTAAAALGIFKDKQEEVNTETKKQGDATAAVAVKTDELTLKLKQQRDEVMKIVAEYKNNTAALREQYQLSVGALSMSKTQAAITTANLQIESKLRSDINAKQQEFAQKDSEYQKNNKQAHLDSIALITKEAEEQKLITAERILQDEKNKILEQQQLAQVNLLVSTRQELNKIQDQYALGLATGKDRIELETHLNQIALLNSAAQQEINASNLLTLEEKKELLKIMSKEYSTMEDTKREAILFKKANIDINQLFQDQVDKIQKIGDAQKKLYEETSTFKYGWAQAFNSYAENATKASSLANQAFSSVTRGMERLIDDFVETGKLSFGDLAQSIIKDLIKIELKAQAMELWKMMGGGGTGGMLGGIGGWIAGLMGFADGGQPPMNKPSIVGENGPELFMPRSAGTVIPNGALGGSNAPTQQITNNTYITNQVSALDAKGVAQLLQENKRMLFGIVESARKEMPMGVR
jgi:lambda family phage tail tape measure protein